MLDRVVDSTEIRAFLGRFQELYAAHRNGARYLIIRGKHASQAKTLLMNYTPQRLEQLACELLTTKEPWISTTDRGLGILLIKASWLDGVLCERERKQQASVQPDPGQYRSIGWFKECARMHGNDCESYQAHVARVQRERGVAS